MDKATEPYKSTAKLFLCSTLSFVIIIIAAGLYEADHFPKDEILLPLLALSLFSASIYYAKNFNFVDYRTLTGFIIFNLYFILSISYQPQPDIEIKTYFIHIISIGLFLTIYLATKIILSSRTSNSTQDRSTTIAFLSITTLCTLLACQLWQACFEHDTFMMRPGGFLNPNTTAALSLIFMFSAFRCISMHNKYLILIPVALSACIIFLAQSRGSMIFFIPFLFYILYKTSNKNTSNIYLLATALFLLFIFFQTGALELVQSAIYRFKGDHNSIARLDIIAKGFLSFLDSPVWGNGYRYLENTYSLSSHNQIIESLSSFGLIGTIIICIAFYYLYTPCSLLFCMLCILPVLLFSHNFFDSYSFQAALGFALAADRKNKPEKINMESSI